MSLQHELSEIDQLEICIERHVVTELGLHGNVPFSRSCRLRYLLSPREERTVHPNGSIAMHDKDALRVLHMRHITKWHRVY